MAYAVTERLRSWALNHHGPEEPRFKGSECVLSCSVRNTILLDAGLWTCYKYLRTCEYKEINAGEGRVRNVSTSLPAIVLLTRWIRSRDGRTPCSFVD